MALNITTKDYETAIQPNRKIHCKINLLNFKYQTVGSFNGVVTDGSVKCDSNSDIRRTVSMSMVLDNPKDEIAINGKLWIDKYMQVFIGITDNSTANINWSNIGIYLIENPSVTYDSTSKAVSISGVDLMAKLTGLRDGNIKGMPVTIPINSSVREVVINILEDFTPFTKYIITDSDMLTPYEIKIDKTATIYNILEELRDILPNWEFFFDVNGVFHWQEIPSGKNEAVLLDNNILDKVVISLKFDYDFDSIKNSIIVFGKSHEPNYYMENLVLADGIYSGEISSITEQLSPYSTVGILISEYTDEPYLKINDCDPIKLQNEDGSFAKLDETDAEVYYVIRIIDNTSALFLGHQQAYGTAKETNPESPFFIGAEAGEIVKVFSGGNYDNIYTDDLARQRAEYELYLNCRMGDTLTLSCLPLYWLDVNILMEYKAIGETEKNKYIIKNFSYNLGVNSTMTISANRYYPEYN